MPHALAVANNVSTLNIDEIESLALRDAGRRDEIGHYAYTRIMMAAHGEAASNTQKVTQAVTPHQHHREKP